MKPPKNTEPESTENAEAAAALFKQRVIEKMQAGLTREQAEEILAAQSQHDAALEN
jgi:hypothetical protein